MRILVDARLLGNAISGVERYLLELISELGNPSVRGLHTIDAYLSGTLQPQFLALPPGLGKRVENPGIAAVRAYDVYHRSFQPHDFSTVIEIGAAPASVLSVHDLIGYRRREYWADLSAFAAYRRTLEYAVIAADRILAISHATKQDLVRTLNVDEARIDVAYLGANPRFRPMRDTPDFERTLAKHQLKPGYLLSVGTDYPHKNRVGLLRAFEMLKDEFPELLLVLAGPRKFGRPQPEVDELLERLTGRVIEIEDVPDDDIVALYNGARVYVFPSLDEGFGLPVIEAFACEIPVVCSNSTSLPEPAGDAAILVDARNPSELRSAIAALLTNESLRAELIAKGRARVHDFTWERTARETIAAYERAAAGRLEPERTVSLAVTSNELPQRFSIVICTRNRSRRLRHTLQSIGRLRSDARYAVEVIVVDNASDDDTRQVAELEGNRLGINLRVVSEPQLGISSARNRGIDSATGDVIIFIDDDVEVPEDLVDAYADAYRRWPRASAIGGRVILKWVANRPSWLNDELSGMLGMTTSGEDEHECTGPRFDVIGCNMSFRRDIFNDLGTFNIELGYRGNQLTGNEENDLLRRIERAGGTIVHSPGAWLYHLIESDKLDRGYFLRRYFNQGIADAHLDLASVPASYSSIDSLRARDLETKGTLKWSATRKIVSGRARFADLVWYRYVQGRLSRIDAALDEMKQDSPLETDFDVGQPPQDLTRARTHELIKDLSARLANSEARLAEITGSESRIWKMYYSIRRKLARRR